MDDDEFKLKIEDMAYVYNAYQSEGENESFLAKIILQDLDLIYHNYPSKLREHYKRYYYELIG